MKILLQRCRNLKCLMLQQTSLQNEHVMAAEWEKADNLQELDISATDLRCEPKKMKPAQKLAILMH